MSEVDEAGRKQYEERTPAMTAGLTGHVWSVAEMLWYREPPARWEPPPQRGRRSHEMKKLIARWCSTAHT